MKNPPSDTRAFTRGNLLKTFEPERVLEVDWDKIRVRARPERGSYAYSRAVNMTAPHEFGRTQTGKLFRQNSTRASCNWTGYFANWMNRAFLATG